MQRALYNRRARAKWAVSSKLYLDIAFPRITRGPPRTLAVVVVSTRETSSAWSHCGVHLKTTGLVQNLKSPESVNSKALIGIFGKTAGSTYEFLDNPMNLPCIPVAHQRSTVG